MSTKRTSESGKAVRAEQLWTIEQAGWQSNLVNIACNGQTIFRDIRRQSANEVIDAHNAALALQDTQEEALAVMAAAVLECAQFMTSNKPTLWGDNYFRYKDLIRNATLIYDLYKSNQLHTIVRGTFTLNKIAEFVAEKTAALPDKEKELETHIAECEQCAGPDDGCDEGQRLEEAVLKAASEHSAHGGHGVESRVP